MKMNAEEIESKRDIKICSVCGDQALGYNFNAITCESCKAFFRRNAMKEKELRCPFKESCQITSVTRRFCQRCRLDKCFYVGMKRELIMSEEDKEKKRRKKLNRFPQQEQQVSSTVTKGTVDICVQTDFPPCSCSCLLSSQSPFNFQNNELRCTPLSSDDKILLNDLVAATKALEAPVDQEINNLYGEEFKSCGSESLIDVINLTSIAIRRLIKMCKRLWGFRALPQCDQLSLLKQGCTQMMLLRSVVSFDPDKNTWKIPHSVEELSRIKVEVLKEARGNLYEAHEAWLRGFDPRAARDLRVICLLTAVALFDPTRTHLSCRELISATQERYYEVLRRYLESLYRLSEAHEIYANLMEKICELRRLNEEHVRVFLNVDPSHV